MKAIISNKLSISNTNKSLLNNLDNTDFTNKKQILNR